MTLLDRIFANCVRVNECSGMATLPQQGGLWQASRSKFIAQNQNEICSSYCCRSNGRKDKGKSRPPFL